MTVREHGHAPYRMAVLHGGPGAPGYMAPLARELAIYIGVIEPLQSADSIRGQVEELADQLRASSGGPYVLVGSSWGAALALFLAASEHQRLVRKLILVGCAVFDSQNSANVGKRRLQRLSPENLRRYEELQRTIAQSSPEKQAALFDEIGELFFDTDVYSPLTRDLEGLDVMYDMHKRVWADFVALRDTPGYLETEFAKIETPTLVIHGDYDPHPIEGIRPLLTKCLRDVKFEILPHCGHYPWIEALAKDRFLKILRDEIESI